MTKVEFIATVAKQGERFAVFVPARYVDKDIRKLHGAKSVKVIIHDEI
jgi:hypothetical protein